MPKQGMSLRMIKDVIRLKWHAQLSHAQIATTLKISKGVVAKYVALATAAGLDWEAVQDWSEQQLSTALQPRSPGSQPVVVPDWGRIHRELDRKGVTLMLLWQEYVAAQPEGRTWHYGNARLEAACERALALGTFRYRHVRDLLANNCDLVAPDAASEWTSPEHANVRGPGY